MKLGRIVALGASMTAAQFVVQFANADQIRTVFVIAMENHNWTQPGSQGSPLPILHNAAAPFINSLVTPGNPNAVQVSYASNYQNVGSGIHPSEPNYLWSEGGTNYGILNDNDPFPNNVHNTTSHLCGFLQSLGLGWKSYQEDTDLATNGSGQITNTPLSPGLYTVPLVSFAGTSPVYSNPYNGRNQYGYAAKHNSPLFFLDTNGGNNSGTNNPEAHYYAPLQALQSDLANNTVAPYNWISPNLYNDMHTALTGSFVYNGTSWSSDSASIAQGDNFLSIVVPMIMASQAYQNNGVIVIWNDETEGGDDASRTIMEIVISPLAKGNAYTNQIRYTHSSDLKSWQKVFGIGPLAGIGDAQNATDLSDLFVPGALGPDRVGPSAYSLFRGNLISGSLSSLVNLDQSYLQVQPGLTLNSQEAPVQVILTATSPAATASDLKFDLVSHVDSTGLTQSIELYDWTTSSYVLLDARHSSMSDSTVEIDAPSPDRFIKSGTNTLQARVSYRPTGLLFHWPFNTLIDQTIWKISP